MCVVLGGMLVGSLAYNLPGYPALLFQRASKPAIILLNGFIGQAVWLWFVIVGSWVAHTLRRGPDDPSGTRRGLPASRWGLVLILVVGLLIGLFLPRLTIEGTHKITKKAQQITGRLTYAVDPAQPATVLSRAGECEAIMYTDEVPMYFFLSYGALDCGAVYYPALAGTPEEQTWMTGDERPRYLVAEHPIRRLFNEHDGAIVLAEGEELRVNSKSPLPLTSLYFYLENPGDEAIVALHSPGNPLPEGQEAATQFRVPAQSSVWVQGAVEDEWVADTFTLEVLQASRPIELRGLRIGDDVELDWPWDQGVTFIYRPGGAQTGAQRVRFESAKLYPGPEDSVDVRVLSDSGSTVLAEISLPGQGDAK
jgi:hypothetical protein